MKESNKIQSVIITLDDGTICHFSGRAVVWKGDKRRVIDIKFSEPKDLPDDCRFEVLDFAKN